jgi:hypothetical protein
MKAILVCVYGRPTEIIDIQFLVSESSPARIPDFETYLNLMAATFADSCCSCRRLLLLPLLPTAATPATAAAPALASLLPTTSASAVASTPYWMLLLPAAVTPDGGYTVLSLAGCLLQLLQRRLLLLLRQNPFLCSQAFLLLMLSPPLAGSLAPCFFAASVAVLEVAAPTLHVRLSSFSPPLEYVPCI